MATINDWKLAKELAYHFDHVLWLLALGEIGCDGNYRPIREYVYSKIRHHWENEVFSK
jgi:hypothetical protein